jgi:hypothetical protein
MLADMIVYIKDSQVTCGHLKDDWRVLENMISNFKNLPSFVWHIGQNVKVNGVDIYREIDDSITQYKAGNWETFGKDIGEASAKIFLGGIKEKDPRADKISQLFEGFAKVNGFKFNLLDLLQCIY